MRVTIATSVAFAATLSLPFACTSEAQAGPSSSLEAQQEAFEAKFLTSWNKADAGALAELFAEDGVRVISGQQLPAAGRDAIKATFVEGFQRYNASGDSKLVSDMSALRELGDGVVLGDGTFQLQDKAGEALLGGKWGCVYRQTDGGLQLVMESAHVAKDTLPAPIDFSKVERQTPPVPVLGDAAAYEAAMNKIIATYAEGMKSGDAAKIASTFTEDGIQLVGISSEPHRGRAAIQAAMEAILPAGGYQGTNLEGKILGMKKISDSLLCANGTWQVAGDDGVVMEFGQWGNLMEIQDDGSLLMIMESAGPLHVAP